MKNMEIGGFYYMRLSCRLIVVDCTVNMLSIFDACTSQCSMIIMWQLPLSYVGCYRLPS